MDYLTPSGSVAFAPGVTEATIAVTVCDDADVEGNETLLVSLLDVTGRRTTATGTIDFSDWPPAPAPGWRASEKSRTRDIPLPLTRSRGFQGFAMR